ncbi:hypothetical protein ONZ43_g574 [Nemania bipapillata]|uniref:Uncharacterized protein n=1 Tax=Nemania bipapillata TaxID=110536 RepID=A0ACC2J8I8_9PEZI|nr:hypothetical protein ONZ43_g574 [Nemania bipapillata]
MESLSSHNENDGVLLCMSCADPPNPPDLSDRASSPPGPTSPPLQPMEAYRDSIALSDNDLKEDNGEKKKEKNKSDNNEDNVTVVFEIDDDADPPVRLDKGKAPERPYFRFNLGQRTSSMSHELYSTNAQQAENPTGPAIEDKRLESSADLIRTATNGDSEGSSSATESDSEDASYPSSLFEEDAHDYNSATTVGSALENHVTSWKQKEKQKAVPEAETGSLSGGSEEETPFQPMNPGDPGWEKSADRPPQKLPIRFQDAVMRNFLFPWEKAKTWTGMKKLVEDSFKHVDVVGPQLDSGNAEYVCRRFIIIATRTIE